ncbi:unnamed protein product [Bemisia tabaci]|uniref:Uncharacterized protein n=1 Tax=Bemisia tabaci TaxID=7038 RepID=A0A9P0A4L4_BEMTA|nr:unnamed protein product [Bemisia tabaci]
MDKSQNRQSELSTSDSSSKSTICQDEPPDKGRPVDLIKLDAFVNVLKHCEKLGDEKNCCTVTELQGEMKIIISSKNLEPCSIKYLKNKLLEHFKDEIISAESKGLLSPLKFTPTSVTSGDPKSQHAAVLLTAEPDKAGSLRVSVMGSPHCTLYFPPGLDERIGQLP